MKSGGTATSRGSVSSQEPPAHRCHAAAVGVVVDRHPHGRPFARSQALDDIPGNLDAGSRLTAQLDGRMKSHTADSAPSAELIHLVGQDSVLADAPGHSLDAVEPGVALVAGLEDRSGEDDSALGGLLWRPSRDR